MLNWEWLGGLLVVGAIGLAGVGASGERKAAEIVTRLGGHYEIEPRFGLECLGVIVEVELTECAPTAADLAEIGYLRHLRVLDLSRTPIGDRELVQLVDSTCQFIIVPDGQTSDAARALFDESRLALGIGVSEFALPGAGGLSLSAMGSPLLEHEKQSRTANSSSVEQTSLAAKRSPAARRSARQWRKG